MDDDHLRRLLEEVRDGQLDIEAALQNLRKLPFDDSGFAEIDNRHCIRVGGPEVIFCQRKSVLQIQEIVEKMAQNHRYVLATRADVHVFEGIQEIVADCTYNESARMVIINPREGERIGNIAVVSAATSDIPVAEEAAVTAEALGNRVNRIYDV